MKFKAPKRLPEANVQAELYRLLRNNKFRCCLEYKTKTFQVEVIRIDCVVIDEFDNVILAIETKSSMRKEKRVNTGTKQFERYEKLGIPFCYCHNFAQIKPILIGLSRGIPAGVKFISNFDKLF